MACRREPAPLSLVLATVKTAPGAVGTNSSTGPRHSKRRSCIFMIPGSLAGTIRHPCSIRPATFVSNLVENCNREFSGLSLTQPGGTERYDSIKCQFAKSTSAFTRYELSTPPLRKGTEAQTLGCLLDLPICFEKSCLRGVVIGAGQFAHDAHCAIPQLVVRGLHVDHQVPEHFAEAHHRQSREDVQNQLGRSAGFEPSRARQHFGPDARRDHKRGSIRGRNPQVWIEAEQNRRGASALGFAQRAPHKWRAATRRDAHDCIAPSDSTEFHGPGAC